MAEGRIPRTPYARRRRETEPKQALTATTQRKQVERADFFGTPSYPRKARGEVTLDNIQKMIDIGVDPTQLYGEEAVISAFPQPKQYDESQPGYYNTDFTTYDSEGNAVYEGDRFTAFTFDQTLGDIIPNPVLETSGEFYKHFYFDERRGNWISTKTDNPILPKRYLTGWEEFYMGALDPANRAIHQLMISGSAFFEKIADRDVATSRGGYESSGNALLDSYADLGLGFRAGFKKLIINEDNQVFAGFGYGWRTDAAPNQPGWMKGIAGMLGVDNSHWAFETYQAKKHDEYEAKQYDRVKNMNMRVFQGMFSDENALGYKALSAYMAVMPFNRGGVQEEILLNKSVGRSLENLIASSATLLMAFADPAAAIDLSLTGGVSITRKLRYMNMFGLAGDSRRVFDQYRRILKAPGHGPEVLMEVMRRNNPDKMNADYWAKLFRETAKRKKTFAPFQNLIKRPEKYGMDELKKFVALDPETAIKSLGVEGYNKLIELLPPTSVINGRPVYNRADLLNSAVKSYDARILREFNMDELIPLFDDITAKTVRPQSIISRSDAINHARKTLENMEEAAVKADKLMDNLTRGENFVTGTREEISEYAAARRASLGYGQEKFRLDNMNADDFLEGLMTAKVTKDGAEKVIGKRRPAPEGAAENMADVTRQLSDPAVVSTTGQTRFRQTNWNKFQNIITSFSKRDTSWWRNFIAKDETFRWNVGGKMGGVTEDAIAIVKQDMKDLRGYARNLDTWEANINEANRLLAKYPNLKLPKRMFRGMQIRNIALRFGPRSESFNTMPGLENMKSLDETLTDITDKAGRIRPEAADKMNLWVAQRRIWDADLLEPMVTEAGFNVDRLPNGVIAGGKFKNQGEAIDALLVHAGLGQTYKSKKVGNLWTVVESQPVMASETATRTANNASDTFSVVVSQNGVNSGAASKVDIAEKATNLIGKQSLEDYDKQVKTYFGRKATPKQITDALWQEEKHPGGASLGDIGTNRIDQFLGEDLLENWTGVTTAEGDAKIISQLRDRMDASHTLNQGDDFIEILDGTQVLFRKEAAPDMQGRAIMDAIKEGAEQGNIYKLHSFPIPGLNVLGKGILHTAKWMDELIVKIHDGTLKRSPKMAQEAYSDLKRYVGEKAAKAWLDARERFGPDAYKELLRMREVWIRNASRHETMNQIIDELAGSMGIEKKWKNLYIGGKFRMPHKTKEGRRIIQGLEEMGRAAEGIKSMSADGKNIEFGTKTYKNFIERVPMDTYVNESGVTVARPGFKKGRVIRDETDPGTWNTLEIDGKSYELNAKNSEKLWNNLSETQKKYVREYVREGGTQEKMFNNWETFNRETAREFYNITSNREGYLHHSFHWSDSKRHIDDLPDDHDFAPLQGARERDQFDRGEMKYRFGRKKLREGVAGPRKGRVKDKKGYKQNFLESIADYNLKLDKEAIRNDAMKGFERKTMLSAAEVDELYLTDPGKAARYKEYRPAFAHEDIAKGEKMYVDDLIYQELTSTAGLSKELSDLNKVLRIGKLQLLVAPATWATNAAGGTLQFGAYAFENLFRAVQGDKLAQRKLTNMHKAFINAMRRKIPEEIFGARSNMATQFGEGQGIVNKFIAKQLMPMGAIENFFKRGLMETELLARKMNWEDLVTQEGRIKDMDTLFDINKQMDLYTFDYNNKSQLAEFFQKNPFGVMVAPFATYPYKYSKMVGYYMDAFNPRSWTKLYDPKYVSQVGVKGAEEARRGMKAKFLVASSVIMTAMAEGLTTNDKPLPPYKDGMDYRLDGTGRVNFGWMDPDTYMRYTKYPGLDVYVPIRKMFQRIASGETLSETKDATFDEAMAVWGEKFSVGNTASLVMNALGYRNKYEQNKSIWQLAINKGYSHIPFLGSSKRLGEDLNRIFEQQQGYVSRTKRSAWTQLMSHIPGTALIDPRTQGDITSTSQPRDDEWKRFLLGYNVRKIDVEESIKEYEKAIGRTLRKEEATRMREAAGEWIDARQKERKGKRRRRRRR